MLNMQQQKSYITYAALNAANIYILTTIRYLECLIKKYFDIQFYFYAYYHNKK